MRCLNTVIVFCIRIRYHIQDTLCRLGKILGTNNNQIQIIISKKLNQKMLSKLQLKFDNQFELSLAFIPKLA